MEVIRLADLAITPWRNLAGRKADIASGDGWMAGIAFLERDAPFSDFTGHDRTITLIDGPGFELDIAGRGVLRVDRPLSPLRFDGGAASTCRLLGGPCRVLNAMTARAHYAHEVRLPRGPAVTLAAPSPGGMNVMVIVRGNGRLADGTIMAPLDAARFGEAMTIVGDDELICWTSTIAPRGAHLHDETPK